VAASQTGEIAAEFSDGTVRFWTRDGTSPSGPIHVTDGDFTGGAFSADGRLFVTTEASKSSEDPAEVRWGEVHLIDVRSKRVIGKLLHMSHGTWAAAFSPDGRRIVVVADNSDAVLFDTGSGRELSAFHVIDNPRQVVWSPDSRKIAVGGWLGGGFAIYDTNSHTKLWGQDELQGLAWSPDGATVATGGYPGVGIELWRASDGGSLGGQWRDHAIPAFIAYSPDGTTLASSGFDGSVVMRDIATGDQIGPPLVASYNQRSFVRFDAAGHLIVATVDGGLWRWNITLGSMLKTACAIAGRNLTTAQWDDLHTGRPYTAACP